MEFHDFCKKKNIITLYIPSHLSYLLQPLDVGCFAPLKVAYGRQIENLMRNHINHITKLEFLPAFKSAFDATFTKSNIQASFQGAGLVPFNPDAVISKLDIKLRTPSPSPPETTPWESKIPKTEAELTSQTKFLEERLARHQNSSLTLINAAIGQLLKDV